MDIVDKKQLLVSIVTPAFNAEQYICESIESALNQTYKNFELIIVIDNCTDNTKAIAEEYAKKDSRVKVFETSGNKLGALGSRNFGIEKATGRFIAFLDSDDYWEPNKLEIQVKFMLENDIAFCYGNYRAKVGDEFKTFIAPKSANYKQIIKANCIGCLTVIYDVEKLGKVYMPDGSYQREDFAAWLSVLRRIPYAYNCNEIVATYRVVESSVSNKKRRMIKQHWKVLRELEHHSRIKSFYYLCCQILYKLFKKSY